MVGWHHRLNGHGFEWTPGVGDGQGGLACYSSWGHKESDTTEQLNWTETENTRERIDLKETQSKKVNGNRITHIKITLNVKGLNVPTKRQGLAELTRKQHPCACCLQETNLRHRDTHRLKVKSWKKILHANGNQKEVGVAILIPDKIDFKIKPVIRDSERSHIMIKGPILKKIQQL